MSEDHCSIWTYKRDFHLKIYDEDEETEANRLSTVPRPAVSDIEKKKVSDILSEKQEVDPIPAADEKNGQFKALNTRVNHINDQRALAKNLMPVDEFVQAAKEGLWRQVAELSDGVIDINTANNADGWNALTAAASNGNTEVVKLLLLKGADPKLKDRAGRSALEMAQNNGRRETAEVLREALGVGAQKRAPSTKNGHNPTPLKKSKIDSQ